MLPCCCLRNCHPEGGTTEGSIQLPVIGVGVTDPSQAQDDNHLEHRKALRGYISSLTSVRAMLGSMPSGRWALGPPSARTGSSSSSAGRSSRFQNSPIGISSPQV